MNGKISGGKPQMQPEFKRNSPEQNNVGLDSMSQAVQKL
jgi:hypothetical protein